MNTSKDPQTQAPTYATRVYHLDALAAYDLASLAAALDLDADRDIDTVTIEKIRTNPAFPELRKFAADVEDLMERLMPDWSRAFPIVEVSLPRAARSLAAADPTFAYWQPSAADLLRHAAIGSIACITLHQAEASHGFTIELASGDQAVHLHAELPIDGPRAELACSFDNIEAEPEARPLVATLNRRTDSDIALLRSRGLTRTHQRPPQCRHMDPGVHGRALADRRRRPRLRPLRRRHRHASCGRTPRAHLEPPPQRPPRGGGCLSQLLRSATVSGASNVGAPCPW
jgi:hypothetical protein